MGMDIYGINATTEKGSYFRNNVWWWRPLADYILENHGDIAVNCESWHSNDGAGLDEDLSLALAKRLEEDLATGKVQKYQDAYNYERAQLPREDCDLCGATGIRTDKVGLELDMPNKELPPEMVSLTGRTHGTCNACLGAGTRENWSMSYPFDIENVREFTEFLKGCGGFSIC
jgi:hypothetical protein